MADANVIRVQETGEESYWKGDAVHNIVENLNLRRMVGKTNVILFY